MLWLLEELRRRPAQPPWRALQLRALSVRNEDPSKASRPGTEIEMDLSLVTGQGLWSSRNTSTQREGAQKFIAN